MSDEHVGLITERLRMLTALPRGDTASFDLADFISWDPIPLDDVEAFTLLLMIGDQDWVDAYRGKWPPQAKARLDSWIGVLRPFIDHLLNLDDYADDWRRLQVAYVTVRFPTFVDQQVHVKVVRLRGESERYVMTPNSFARFIGSLLNELRRATDEAISEIEEGNLVQLAAEIDDAAKYLKEKRRPAH
jgi:hypothetical protein